jgi:hypothetical protein
MGLPSSYTSVGITAVIREALVMVTQREAGVFDRNTPLTGKEAVIDSVGFVTLLITVEQGLNGVVDLAADFMEHGSVGEETNPFRTLGSLADHIYDLVAPTDRVVAREEEV